MTTDDDFLLAQIQDAQRDRNATLGKIKKCGTCNKIAVVFEGLCRNCCSKMVDKAIEDDK